MPAILAFLVHPATIAIAGISAWFGAQIDDKLEPAQSVPVTKQIDPIKIGLYIAGGLGLFWLANKSGFLKLLK